ncbi:MAG: hypothetical protein JW839_04400 [Candidatus Lokiarchaeota archaeon]|nr:hypothetical protein [Candidatus Lokiarchaeota archaeon]
MSPSQHGILLLDENRGQPQHGRLEEASFWIAFWKRASSNELRVVMLLMKEHPFDETLKDAEAVG